MVWNVNDLYNILSDHEGDHYCLTANHRSAFGSCLPRELAKRARDAEAKVAAVETLVWTWEQSAARPLANSMLDWQARHADELRAALGGKYEETMCGELCSCYKCGERG